MKRLNQRGFAIAGILYTLLVVFLGIIFYFLIMLSNRKNILDKIKENVYEDISGIITDELSISFEQIPNTMVEGSSYNLKENFINSSNKQASITCTANDVEIENTSSLTPGNYTLACTIELQNTSDYVEKEISVIKKGTYIYYNPVTGKICTDYTVQNSKSGVKTGCMKWYIYADNDKDNFNLILDHNTTASTAWNLTGNNYTGPDSNFLEKLQSDTSAWVGVPARSDIYTRTSLTANYQIDYSGYRARIISAEEVAKITGYANWADNWYHFDTNSTSSSNTCQEGNTSGCSYGWLYDRTNTTCTTYGCLNNNDVTGNGYWTSTARVGEYYKKMAWRVQAGGIIDCNINYSTIEKEDGKFGIRPVITISKSIVSGVVLNIKGTEYKQSVANTVDFDISGENISDVTNIVCNNGAKVIVENNHVIISDAVSGTVCKMNTSLSSTTTGLDKTKNYILMLKDETLTSNADFKQGTNVEFNLNSKQVNLNGKYLRTYGNLVVNGDSNSKIVSTGQVLNNSGTGTLTVNGGYYERTVGTGTAVYNQGAGTIIINDGKFVNSDNGTAVQNRVGAEEGGTVNINGGIFVTNNIVISNPSKTGVTNINQTDKPITIISLSQIWKPAIQNGATGSMGIINITGNAANECTSDYTATTSGLCVFAEGDKNYTSNTANSAVANTSDGTININGGTYFGGYMGISNHYNGIINILSGDVSSGWSAIVNSRTGTTNICNANISSLKYDLYGSSNVTTGMLNYSSNVVFTNGTNTPATGGITANIVPNYTGTCLS